MLSATRLASAHTDAPSPTLQIAYDLEYSALILLIRANELHAEVGAHPVVPRCTRLLGILAERYAYVAECARALRDGIRAADSEEKIFDLTEQLSAALRVL